MQDLSFIAWCLEHLNYGTIFLLMTIESSFIPFPSEVVVPPAGYLARAGELSSWGVVLASSLGAIAGALINYLLALWLGRPLVYRFVNSRLGHALLLSEAKLIKAEQYFDKRGAISTFIGRLLPGIRQLISIPAGLAKMPLATFLFYTLLGAGLWNTILFLMGYFLPSMVPGIDTKEQLVEQVTKYSHEIGFTLLSLVALVLAILIVKHSPTTKSFFAMTLQQLEYLVALDKHRQFAKAAAACNVTQPTLSTMIQRLEEELGVQLFDRQRQPVQPTAIGEKVIEQARRTLGASALIEELIAESRDTLSGDFTLAVLPTIAPYLIPLVLPKWKARFKDLKLEIVELKTSQCLAALQERSIDMAIIASAPEVEGMQYRLLFYEEFLGYVSRNEKIYCSSVVRSSEVDASRLWLLDEGHCFRDQLVRYCQLSASAKRAIRYSEGNLLSFMHLVEGGQGMTFIPKLAERYLGTDQRSLVRPFAIPRPVRAIHLAFRSDFVRTSLLDAFASTICSSVPQDMLQMAPNQALAK